MPEKIVSLDFGSQYTQLIARRVRELNVYCEIYPYTHIPEFDASVKGVIFSGSPYSVRQDRKSVVSGKSVSVRVDRGGRRIIMKKINNIHVNRWHMTIITNH